MFDYVTRDRKGRQDSKTKKKKDQKELGVVIKISNKGKELVSSEKIITLSYSVQMYSLSLSVCLSHGPFSVS